MLRYGGFSFSTHKQKDGYVMGVMQHDAIIVTGHYDDPGYKHRSEHQPLELAHSIAVEHCGHLVSPIIDSKVNAEASFLIAPDGSKEGWEKSNEMRISRVAFINAIYGIQVTVVRISYGELGTSIQVNDEPLITGGKNLTNERYRHCPECNSRMYKVHVPEFMRGQDTVDKYECEDCETTYTEEQLANLQQSKPKQKTEEEEELVSVYEYPLRKCPQCGRKTIEDICPSCDTSMENAPIVNPVSYTGRLREGFNSLQRPRKPKKSSADPDPDVTYAQRESKKALG